MTRVHFALHAHLPYVRIPGRRFPLEELWLFQNLTECYIPLILAFRELGSGRVDFRITLSLSPTLLAMLSDGYYRNKYRDYLEALLFLSRRGRAVNGGEAAGALAHLEERVLAVRDFFNDREGDIAGAFGELSGGGKVTLITTAATHALLPAFRFSRDLVRLQVETGLRAFEERFGSRPRGFWLPEMGYHARLDELLRECGIRYTYLDTHSLYRMPPAPRRGNFFPFLTGAGLLVFPREVALSNAIWSKGSGYPGDFSYREFHYDYTYSLPSGDLGAAGADLVPFGLKVYRITGGGGPKEFYEPARAVETARRHAEDFLEKIRARAGVVQELTGEPPVFTLPFDMELFGHWWYEGPEFISHLFRMIASSGDIAHASPEDFAGTDSLETVTPSESSWGRNGHFDTWLTPEVLHIYPEIAELYARLRRRAGGKVRKIAAAAAVRELLLAQSSDWPFFIAWDNFRDYGTRRLAEHLDAAEKIIASMENLTIDEEFIREREEAYPVFGKLRP